MLKIPNQSRGVRQAQFVFLSRILKQGTLGWLTPTAASNQWLRAYELIRHLCIPLIEALIKLLLSDTIEAKELRACLPEP